MNRKYLPIFWRIEKTFFFQLKKSNELIEAVSRPEEVTKSPQPEPTSFLDTSNPEQIIYENPELKVTIWGGIEKENMRRLK